MSAFATGLALVTFAMLATAAPAWGEDEGSPALANTAVPADTSTEPATGSAAATTPETSGESSTVTSDASTTTAADSTTAPPAEETASSETTTTPSDAPPAPTDSTSESTTTAEGSVSTETQGVALVVPKTDTDAELAPAQPKPVQPPAATPQTALIVTVPSPAPVPTAAPVQQTAPAPAPLDSVVAVSDSDVLASRAGAGSTSVIVSVVFTHELPHRPKAAIRPIALSAVEVAILGQEIAAYLELTRSDSAIPRTLAASPSRLLTSSREQSSRSTASDGPPRIPAPADPPPQPDSPSGFSGSASGSGAGIPILLFAALIAAFALWPPEIASRLLLSKPLCRQAAVVSLLERPG
jgi:hypothetical protein